MQIIAARHFIGLTFSKKNSVSGPAPGVIVKPGRKIYIFIKVLEL